MKNTLLTLLLIGLSLSSHAQEVAYGDSMIMVKVKEKTRSIYDNKDATHFFLTNKKLLSTKTRGLNLTVYVKDNQINRIVAIGHTKKGSLGTEWYYSNGELIHTLEAFEYFDEVKNKGNWQNFKGIYSWESRYYLSDGVIGYHKHKGKANVPQKTDTKELTRSSERLYTYAMKRIEGNN